MTERHDHDSHDYTIGRLVERVDAVADAVARIEAKLDVVTERHDVRMRDAEAKLARWGGIGATLLAIWGAFISWVSGVGR